MPFRLHRFVVQYTNRCNYMCAHCGTRSGGRQTTWNLGTDLVSSLLPVLLEFSFTEIVITGGEALLFPDDVFCIVKSASAYGLRTKLISNGSWGQDRNRTVDVLSSLSDAGLDELVISFDRFRLPFGGAVSQVRHIFDENKRQGSRITVRVYTLHPEVGDKTQQRTLSELRRSLPAGSVLVQPIIPVGRGRWSAPLPAPVADEVRVPCHHVFSPFLSHRAELYRCCTGEALGPETPLFLGVIRGAEDLRSELERLRRDRLHKALCTIGPHGIFQAEDNAKRARGLCHYCVEQMQTKTSKTVIESTLRVKSREVDLIYDAVTRRLRRGGHVTPAASNVGHRPCASLSISVSKDGHSYVPALLGPGGWALDVGCRGFEFTNLMTSHGLNVVAVDADPAVRPPPADRIRFVAAAVVAPTTYDAHKTLTLFRSDDRNAFNVFEGDEDRAIRTQTTTLERLRTAFNIDRWEIVKLDCEGSEYEILEQWGGPVAKQISVEFHDYLGRNPEPDPRRYYERLIGHLEPWYETVKHAPQEPPWGGGASLIDSLFVLRSVLDDKVQSPGPKKLVDIVPFART